MYVINIVKKNYCKTTCISNVVSCMYTCRKRKYAKNAIECKVAHVTGGALGIGYACAESLLKAGAKVMISDFDEKAGRKSLCKLNDKYGDGNLAFIKCDVTRNKEFQNALSMTKSTFNGLDCIINNAGILSDSRWAETIQTNATGVVRGTLLGFKYMSEDEGGCGGVVINVASILGLQPLASSPVYAGTKHFVIGFTRSIGAPLHYDRTKVRVMAICPGVTNTSLIHNANPRAMKVAGMGDALQQDLASLPPQAPCSVGDGCIHMINEGCSGSIWVCEGAELYEVEIPNRLKWRI